MDEEADPGVIPAVKHLDLPIDLPKRRRSDEEKKDDKDSPFDETANEKEEQLKELDDIVAKISFESMSTTSEPVPAAKPPGEEVKTPGQSDKAVEPSVIVDSPVHVSDVTTDGEDDPSLTMRALLPPRLVHLSTPDTARVQNRTAGAPVVYARAPPSESSVTSDEGHFYDSTTEDESTKETQSKLDEEEEDTLDEDKDAGESYTNECSPVTACISDAVSLADDIYGCVHVPKAKKDDDIKKGTEQCKTKEDDSIVEENNIPAIKSYPSEEGSLLAPPVPKTALAATSLLGELKEEEDTADRELDYGRNDTDTLGTKTDTWGTNTLDETDGTATLGTVTVGTSAGETDTRGEGDDKSSDPITEAILEGAAFGAALLGIKMGEKSQPMQPNGPNPVSRAIENASEKNADNENQVETKSSADDMPMDERMTPPEGVDSPLAEGPLANADTAIVAATGQLPEPLKEMEKNEDDPTISRDSTFVSDVNNSHDDDVDEEEQPVFEKPKEFPVLQKEAPARKHNRLSYVLIATIVLVIIGIIVLAAGFGSGAFSSTTNPIESAPSPEASTPAPAPGPTTAPAQTTPREIQFVEFFEGKALTDVDINSDSSEAWAIRWLANDDTLQLDPSDTSPRNNLIITQRYALTTILFGSLGAEWVNKTNWLNENECTWYGIACDGRVVVSIDMPENNLVGTISPELALLNSLRTLVFNDNGLSGTFPQTFQDMSSLRILGLRTNDLTGSLEGLDFSPMESLLVFDARENEITGAIPESIYALSNLNFFDVGDNQISGSISPSIGGLVNAQRFVVRGNNIAGSIPTEIGSMTALTTFDISANDIVGPIPAEVGNLVALQEFAVSGNQLDGGLPSSLGNLENLVTLSLQVNRFAGTIPTELAGATSLVNVNIEINRLDGPIPDLGSLTQLQSLRLGNNRFDSAPIPGFIYSLSSLQNLELETSRLTGSLSTEIGNLVNLATLRLDGNELNDTLPVEIGQLTKLEVLRLEENNLLSGPLPAELGQLSALVDLRVTLNSFSGQIPNTIGDLSALTRLSVGSNFLSGNIPDAITRLSTLRIFSCEDNYFQGTIPASIGDMEQLRIFNCPLNRWATQGNVGLEGTIPTSIGNLKNLEIFAVYQNSLNGTIPAELGDCNSLRVLDVELNSFTGTLPEALGSLSNLQTLRVGGNADLQNPLPASVCVIQDLSEYRVGCQLDCTCCNTLCGSRTEMDFV